MSNSNILQVCGVALVSSAVTPNSGPTSMGTVDVMYVATRVGSTIVGIRAEMDGFTIQIF